MANKKFSDFTTKTVSTDVDFLVGYEGSTNVKIAPSNIGGGGAAAFSFDVLKGGFYHSANVIGDVYWFDLITANEATGSPNYDNCFAPYGDGHVKFITLINNQYGALPDCDGIKFYYKESFGTTETLLGTATITNAGAYKMTAKLELADTDLTFSFGDNIAIGFETVVSGVQTGKFYGGWFHIGVEYD